MKDERIRHTSICTTFFYSFRIFCISHKYRKYKKIYNLYLKRYSMTMTMTMTTTTIVSYKSLIFVAFIIIHCAAGFENRQKQKCFIDCAIIGGGPAGLATAIAISKSSPTSSVGIFERDSFQPKGASIQISSSGWKSLADLDSSVVPKLEDTGVAVTAVDLRSWTNIKEEEEKKNMSMTRRSRLKNSIKKPLTKLKSIITQFIFSKVLRRTHLWHDVRVVLRQHAEKLYTGDDSKSKATLINLNLNLENIQSLSPLGGSSSSSSSSRSNQDDDDEARFELIFKNVESGEEMKVRTNYVFACDGINSKVRSILPNEPDVLLSEDKSVWRGMAANIPTSTATFFRGQQDSDTVGRTALIFPGGKNAGSSWSVISDAEDGRANTDEESRRRVLKVVETMGTNSENYKRMKKVIDDSNIIIENKLYVRDFDKPWESSYDGLIYIGDSAHPVRPTGEGTALAFEDANVLGQVVSKYGLGVKALRQYENERYEPVKAISEKVRTDVNNFYKQPNELMVGAATE
jgi:2-polyprenyl-6-methoxyphenol hydroxylase-like FAD-dependent oxidoreductase